MMSVLFTEYLCKYMYQMYLRGNSIGTDNRRQMTDDRRRTTDDGRRRRNTLNLSRVQTQTRDSPCAWVPLVVRYNMKIVKIQYRTRLTPMVRRDIFFLLFYIYTNPTQRPTHDTFFNRCAPIRSSNKDDTDGTSSIVLPCPSSQIMFHLFPDFKIVLKILLCSTFLYM